VSSGGKRAVGDGSRLGGIRGNSRAACTSAGSTGTTSAPGERVPVGGDKQPRREGLNVLHRRTPSRVSLGRPSLAEPRHAYSMALIRPQLPLRRRHPPSRRRLKRIPLVGSASLFTILTLRSEPTRLSRGGRACTAWVDSSRSPSRTEFGFAAPAGNLVGREIAPGGKLLLTWTPRPRSFLFCSLSFCPPFSSAACSSGQR
jgi:hypothetical protein